MAQDYSFDVVSQFDRQELVNAVNQAQREIATRYDFKDTGATIELGENEITLHGPSDFKLKAMLDVLVKAERCAIGGYTNICNITAGKDHRTYDLSLAILHEEIEHEAWFSEFLGEGPSGHFHRTGFGISRNSPYVSKFLHL